MEEASFNPSQGTESVTLRYFQQPKRPFWNWAEGGRLIEWFNGDTLCFTDELTDLLRGQEHTGLPRLGTVLLVMAACQDGWHQSRRIQQLDEKFVYGERGHENLLESRLYAAKRFLDMVADLPADLRKGRRRIHLLRRFTQALNTPEIAPAQVPHLLDYFQSGQLDGPIFSQVSPDEESRYALELDLWTFRQVYPRFHNVTELEHYLRTGLEEPPPPAPLDLPNEAPPADLLEQLAHDSDTAGLARLAQRLVAALHIPLHAQGSSDLPLGGVSDITNRGDFDRLLLSELAQDDLTLTARLVNNEALFLRREEPPQHLERQRTVLMDTTLKMWGLPRVFALSTALACVRPEKNIASAQAFALSGEGFEPMDLCSKAGVTDALTRLDAALHCAQGLRAFFAKTPASDTHDHILVTDAEAMRDPDFQAAFAEIRTRLRFLAMLHRDGRLEFFEYTNGHRKLLFSPKFDLQSLLFPKGKTRKPEPDEEEWMKTNEWIPAFFRQKPPPLRFPLRGASRSKKRCLEHPSGGLTMVTQHGRVLYWHSGDMGALELLPNIEPAENYRIGYGTGGEIYILATRQSGLWSRLYWFVPVRNTQNTNQIAHFLTSSLDFKDVMGVIRTAAFYDDRLAVYRWALGEKKPGIFYFNCLTQTEEPCPLSTEELEATSQAYWQQIPDAQWLRRKFNPPYRSIITARYIGLDLKNRRLMLDGYALTNSGLDALVWARQGGGHEQSVRLAHYAHPLNPKIKLTIRTWRDGSQAMLDSRGLLHLRSSDPALPEATIVAVTDAPLAWWLSSGQSGGHPYFLIPSEGEYWDAAKFQWKYLEAFIERLETNRPKMMS